MYKNTKAIIFLVFIILVCIAFVYRSNLVPLISDWVIAQPPPMAALVYVVIFTLASVLLVPNSILMILAGVLFGMGWGIVINITSFTLGAVISFILSRFIFADKVRETIYTGRTRKVLEGVSTPGWKLVALMRIFPVMPAFILNYALGVSRIRLWDFAWASFVFTLPTTSVLTFTGVTGQKLLTDGETLWANIVMAAILLGILGAVGMYSKSRFGVKNGNLGMKVAPGDDR